MTPAPARDLGAGRGAKTARQLREDVWWIDQSRWSQGIAPPMASEWAQS